MSTAKQRYISCSFWDDPWIMELDPSEKLLYMYFMTNPLTNISGVYKVADRRIAFDTGFNTDTVRHIMRKFEDAGKAHRYGEYIIIPTWPKHQKWEQKTKIKDGIISALQELPIEVLVELERVDYRFDLSLVDNTIISSKQRKQISGTTIKKVREKFNQRCADCGADENLNIHHITPLKEGGDNSFDNLELLCETCHKKKHSPDTISGLNAQSRYDTNYSDSEFDSERDRDRETEGEPRQASAAPALPEESPPSPEDLSPLPDPRQPATDLASEWYREYSRRTTRLIAPGEDDIKAAWGLLQRTDLPTARDAIPIYFDCDAWFMFDRGKKTKRYSFRSFCQHFTELSDPGGSKLDLDNLEAVDF